MANKAFDHSKYERWIDPNEVTPYQFNAKEHTDKQISNIANSISRFGWQQDTVITSDGILVIGHGRRLAALQLGCEMPYHVIDKTADELTDEDIRELRIVDNKTNESEWDFDLLAEELPEIDLSAFDFDFGLDNEKEKKKPDEPEVEFSEELLLSHNYIVLYFDNDFDWEVAKDKFGLKEVKDLIPRKGQGTGIGRVINGKRILEWNEN